MSIIRNLDELLGEDEKLIFKTRQHSLILVWPTILLMVAIFIIFHSSDISVFIGKVTFVGYDEEFVEKYDVERNDPFREDLWKKDNSHKVLVVAIIVLAGLMIALLFAWEAINYFTTEYAVTDKRALTKSGLVGTYASKTLLHKIESVKDSQGPIKRLFGCGDVVIIGTGGDRDYYTYVLDYKGFVRAVEAAITASHDR